MSIREQIRSKSAALVKREKVTLPECGVEVQVRGLMSGEAQRVSDAKRSNATQIALSVEDPITGKALWNPNDLNDLNEIDELHMNDFALLVNTGSRLSGIGTEGKVSSPSSENSVLPSPESSEEVSAR